MIFNFRCTEAKGTFKCDTCSVTFEWRSHLADHLSTVHNIRTKIDTKKTVLIPDPKTKPSLLKVKIAQGKTCAFCHKQFRNAKALALHISQVHPLNEEKDPLKEEFTTFGIICEECNSEFPNVNALNSHQVNCLYETRCFPCRKCDTFWNSALTVKLHYSEVHGECIEVCGICGNILSNSQALEAHCQQWHLDTEKYVCDFCDKEFYNRGSLDNHTFKVHKIQTSFSCELCSYACSRKNELESHIQAMHGHIDRHFCDICQFSSFKKNRLDLHKRKSHRYTCAHCNLNFETAREKYQHEKDHNLKRTKRKKM